MFYLATAVLLCGLAIQAWRFSSERHRHPPVGTSPRGGRWWFRTATDVLLLRRTFFSDRWAWIFGACFHFGLALTLLRHLRYILEPAWIGPLWKLVELVQPFGFYGGLALPVGAACWWGRQVVLRQGRIITHLVDHLVMGLLIAIPVVGYANTLVHTDVVAVKAFWIGLWTFDWKELPSDPLLLTHLWLVAVLMVALPFSRLLLLLPFGPLLRLHKATPSRAGGDRWLARGIIVLAGVLFLVPAAFAVQQMAQTGWRAPPPNFARLASAHRSDDPTVMIRSHPAFLMAHRSVVVYQGARNQTDSLERCVTCHAVKGGDGLPVSFADPRHFCRSCHLTVAVSIDCFECHTSKPVPEAAAALTAPANPPSTPPSAEEKAAP